MIRDLWDAFMLWVDDAVIRFLAKNKNAGPCPELVRPKVRWVYLGPRPIPDPVAVLDDLCRYHGQDGFQWVAAPLRSMAVSHYAPTKASTVLYLRGSSLDHSWMLVHLRIQKGELVYCATSMDFGPNRVMVPCDSKYPDIVGEYKRMALTLATTAAEDLVDELSKCDPKTTHTTSRPRAAS